MHGESALPIDGLGRRSRTAEGASLVEYSLLVALLAAASIAILYGLGQNIKGLYTQVNTAVGTANVGITSAGQ